MHGQWIAAIFPTARMGFSRSQVCDLDKPSRAVGKMIAADCMLNLRGWLGLYYTSRYIYTLRREAESKDSLLRATALMAQQQTGDTEHATRKAPLTWRPCPTAAASIERARSMESAAEAGSETHAGWDESFSIILGSSVTLRGHTTPQCYLRSQKLHPNQSLLSTQDSYLYRKCRSDHLYLLLITLLQPLLFCWTNKSTDKSTVIHHFKLVLPTLGFN